MNNPRAGTSAFLRIAVAACACAGSCARRLPTRACGRSRTRPSKALKATYDFTPTAEWLDALRLSAVRIGGGSGSFVSADGLVLTNHHIAMGCLQSLSTEADDLVKNGFHARARATSGSAREWRCGASSPSKT